MPTADDPAAGVFVRSSRTVLHGRDTAADRRLRLHARLRLPMPGCSGLWRRRATADGLAIRANDAVRPSLQLSAAASDLRRGRANCNLSCATAASAPTNRLSNRTIFVSNRASL